MLVENGMSAGNILGEVRRGKATGVIIDTDVHILKQSNSRYRLLWMYTDGQQYCCRDVCCDGGTVVDVKEVVAEAKKIFGVTRVILRDGPWASQVEGLPVSDVKEHVGILGEYAEIYDYHYGPSRTG